MDTIDNLNKAISSHFADAFRNHPDRKLDPGSALEDARNSAAELLPADVTGSFDDERLTFTADGQYALVYARVPGAVPTVRACYRTIGEARKAATQVQRRDLSAGDVRIDASDGTRVLSDGPCR